MGDTVKAFRAAMLADLGHVPEVIEPGKLHRFSTSDRRVDDAGWCKLFADGRGGVFGDWRTGASRTWSAIEPRAMTRAQRAALARQIEAATVERVRVQREQWARNGERVTRQWAQCVPLVPGDPVTMYLERRGLGRAWPLPACLRLHPALTYFEGDERIGAFPAMVAPLVAPDGRVVALHRTFLTADGRKADVKSPRKLTTTAGPLAGAGIRLHEPWHGVIGVAEGIETALAAWLASGVPTVAAYSADNLGAWEWPMNVQRVVVFADNDHAGRTAADALHTRARFAGLRCEVLTPSDDGADWADVWAARCAVQIARNGA